jgi:hypothetical protein
MPILVCITRTLSGRSVSSTMRPVRCLPRSTGFIVLGLIDHKVLIYLYSFRHDGCFVTQYVPTRSL